MECTHNGVGNACCPDPDCQHAYELPPATRGISQGFCIFCNRGNRFRANNRDTVFYYLKRESLYPDAFHSSLHIITTKMLDREYSSLAALVGVPPTNNTDQAITILEKFSKESGWEST